MIHFIMTFRIKRIEVIGRTTDKGICRPPKTVVWGSRSGAAARKGSCSTAAGCALCVASCVTILQIQRSIRHLFVMNGWSIQITAGVPSRAPATCLCYPLCLGSFSEL